MSSSTHVCEPNLPRRKPPLPPPHKATSSPSNKVAEQNFVQQHSGMSNKKDAPPPRPPPPRPPLRISHSLDIQNLPSRPPPPTAAALNKLSGTKSLNIQEINATRPSRTNGPSPRRPARPPPAAPSPAMQAEKPSIFMETMGSLHGCSIPISEDGDRPKRLAPVSPIRAPPDQPANDSSDSGLREAVCPFTADAVYELSFEEGESIMEMEPPDDLGWCLGIKDDGTQGYYPSTYVKPVGLFQ